MLPIAPLTILFIGNSHTTNLDVPFQVAELLRSAGRLARTKTLAVSDLEQGAKLATVLSEIKKGGWDVVVLQGAAISQSHKFNYSQDGAVLLAKTAVAKGSRVGFYAEWPRRGWDETEYILGIYTSNAKLAKCEVIPVPKVWDAARVSFPTADWWAPDGNHSGSFGAYTASFTIAGWLDPKALADITWKPTSVTVAQQRKLRESVVNLLK